MHDLREHTHVVEAVAFAPETAQRTLAAASSAGFNPLSSSSSFAARAPYSNGSALGVMVMGNGIDNGEGGGMGDEGGMGAARRFVVSGSRDMTVKLWNASVGNCLMTLVSSGLGDWLCMFVIHVYD